jgi:leader peptidase (prepilin peptidase)/N-methyltransferase
MTILLTVVFTLLGIAIGSFLNVCIDRLPLRKSLVFPPSHCDACQQRIAMKDMVPILSYLWLRGRCRYCRARIPRRVLLVEVASGLIFFLAFWRFGLSSQFAITAFWSCVFLIIIFIDWEYKLILNRLTYPAAVLAIIILAIDSFIPGTVLFPGRIFIPELSILSGLISGIILLVFFLLIIIIRPGAMGMGDAKLVALIGFVSGFPLVIFSMFIGIFIGGGVAIGILIYKMKKNWKDSFRLFRIKKWKDGLQLLFKGRKDEMAYGAFLGIGPIFALLFGNEIVDWYLRLGRFH